MIKKHNRFGITTLLLSMLVMCTAPLSASAQTRDTSGDNEEHECSLTVDYHEDEEPIQGAVFDIYLAAEFDEDGDYVIDPEFEGASVSLDYDDESDLSDFAETIETYIIKMKEEGQEIEPYAEGVIGEDGQLEFDELEEGLYIVVGETHVIDDIEYVPLASAVPLPYYEDEEDEEPDHNPIVYPKFQVLSSTYAKPVSLTAQKVWEDAGYESERPESVEVVLYCNGEEYDKATLSEDNNWQYEWDKLDGTARWQLTEENVPDNYTMTSVLDNNVFTVTNTFKVKVLSESGTTSKADTPSKSTSKADDSGVPNTGENWWTISVLSFIGLILIVAIWNVNSKSSKH